MSYSPNAAYSPPNAMRHRTHAKTGAVQHGVAHMTAASRQIHNLGFGGGSSSTSTRRRRSKKSASAAPRKRRASTRHAATGAAAKFVKGSAAAKAHMTKLRKMRGKKKAA